MKKILCLLGAVIFSAGLFAQVMGSSGVRNTLSTGFGMPYGDVKVDRSSNLRFHGFIDTLQVRFDVSKFTVEGMLNWGAFPSGNGFVFQNTERNPFWYNNHAWYGDKYGYGQGSWWTNGNTESYYVNFLFHPIKEIDIGMGTRLNWKIGPAPSSDDNYWGPKAHIVQGGLKDAVPGKADVVGFTYYANKYTSNYANGLSNSGQYANAAIGVRYFYNNLFEVGFALPSWPDYNNAKFNLAFNVKPFNFFKAYIAYDGILQSSSSNLYTGFSLYFDNLDINVYLAGNFRQKGGSSDNPINNDLFGFGFDATMLFPSINLTLNPEVGFTFYMNPNYTMAWYIGNRLDVSFEKKFNLGAWVSVAVGAKDKRWGESRSGNYHKDYVNGFIFDIRPDFSFNINKHHDVSLYFDYQNRTTFMNKNYNVWSAGIYWTYKY